MVKDAGIKRKRQHKKNDNSTRGNKPENTGERRKIKKTLRQCITIQAKQNIPKQRKKILPRSRGRWHKHISITGCKGS